MLPSTRRDIPDFLQDQILCVCKFQRKNKRSHLALLKTLKFYEFQQKQMITCLDLRSTSISKLTDRIRDYNSPKPEQFVENGGGSPEKTLEMPTKSEVYFGKFIYRNLDVYQLYILLHCWDKLIVLRQYSTESDYQVHAEYEGVATYKLVHGNIKFEVFVKINFEDGRSICTNFHENYFKEEKAPTIKQPNREEFEQLLERVRISTTELHIHKAVTQRNFERLRDRQAFGCNFVRSLNMDEKQIVSRYGDCWMRFTADDTFVLGVPLVNNCTASSLMVLSNVQPILKPSSEVGKSIKYTYRLYQLQQQFENLDSIETYFQSEEENNHSSFWVPSEGQQLLPESFAVLLIKLSISDVIQLRECAMFLHFKLKKDLRLQLETEQTKSQEYEQHIHLKTINFHHILRQREALEVSFAENTLHQDFLALAFSSVEIKLAIEFKSLDDLAVFENALLKKFNFINVKRQVRQDTDFEMKIDDTEETETNSKQSCLHTLYYNSQYTSMWYGLMVLQEVASANRKTTIWKFYTKTKPKAYLLIKVLLDDMLESNCNINKVEYPVRENPFNQIAVFEDALRQELMSLVRFIKGKSTYDDIISLLQTQAETDVIASNLSLL